MIVWLCILCRQAHVHAPMHSEQNLGCARLDMYAYNVNQTRIIHDVRLLLTPIELCIRRTPNTLRSCLGGIFLANLLRDPQAWASALIVQIDYRIQGV